MVRTGTDRHRLSARGEVRLYGRVDLPHSTDLLVEGRFLEYDTIMVVIHFADAESKRRALGFMAGRFSFKSWSTGEMVVPDSALAHLANAGIPFVVEGPATYERLISSIRKPPASPV